MSPTERLRQILPFAAALYLAISVAHLQAKQPAVQLPRDGISLKRITASIKWHLIEMAKTEQAEALIAFPGN
ncbi:hypothetical protein [Methylobacterium brachythecii]|uniref:Uncharacterized protein n=1 Tax=Methylobacterium brachythecii TaxID=1176177 RepID=A0A7W6AGJ0_9HYPH|nr:hypothetical protein [Methylobacterium brachythecii]MBB3901901.1 hypothetical protein [Methylobacterium brachythecii]GLS43281.1 hypothetical protein GCM10007884_12660 [Methylobacterium brachythecii]